MSGLPMYSSIEFVRPERERLAEEAQTLISRWDSAVDFNTQLEVLEAWQQACMELETEGNIAYGRFAQDTTNAAYKANKEFFDDLTPELKEMKQSMIKRLIGSPHREALEERYGHHVFDTWELELTTFDPIIADDEREVSTRINRYNVLQASIRIPFQGKEWNLSTIRALTGDADRAIREGASKAKEAAIRPHREELDQLFDDLTSIRTRMADRMGQSTYTPLGYARMGRTDYGPGEVEVFRSQVRELLVPICSRIWERRARSLGVDQLALWDEPVRDLHGVPCPKGDRAWMVERATEMFDQMEGDFGVFFRLLRDHELMDLDSRDGKQGGGFCMDLPRYGMPFIFANFAGTQADVKVFTHECGHAYQYWKSNQEQPLLEYCWPTSEAAEIHSMALEFLTHPHMELFFHEDADRFREGHLEGALLFIPYGCAVDHFQHMVYANPSASADDRAVMWQECERLYLPHRNYSGLPFFQSGRFWQLQRHIFRNPFYYIDYCLAQTVALQLWHGSLQARGETMGRYESLCRLGGSRSFSGLLQDVDLANPLHPGSLEKVLDTAARVLNLD